MADWPDLRALSWAPAGFVSIASERHESYSVAPSNNAWPSANLAIYFPLRVPVQITVYKIAVGCGSTAGGNFDAGIFDTNGNKLVSTGATARVADSEVIVDVTDTKIGPGLFYFGMSADGTDSYIMFNQLNVSRGRLLGQMQQATAYTLPTTATFAANTATLCPSIAAYLKAL